MDALANPRETLKSASPLARFAEIDAEQFRSEVEQIGRSLTNVHEAITVEVEAERLTPVQGLAWISCTTGQAFGYAEFHGLPSPTDVVLKAMQAGNDSSR